MSANGYERRLRRMEPRDLDAVKRITAAQNRRDGTSYPPPDVFELRPNHAGFGREKPNIVLALVTERRKGEGPWRVAQWHVWLRTVEMMDGGGSAVDTAFSIEHLGLIESMLREKDFFDLHVLVPRARVAEIGAFLHGKGLTRIDNRLAHYYKELGAEAGARAGSEAA